MQYTHFKNLLKQVILHHFVANRGLKRTGRSVICHVVMLKNEIQKLFSSTSAQGAYSGELFLLTEAAIVSSLEEQGFKHGSSSLGGLGPSLVRANKKGFLGCT